MNTSLLSTSIQNFIDKHLTTPLTTLILKGSPFEKATIQELANQIVAKQKAKQKLPTWFNTKNIYYPPKVSIEQSSSEITALYKSNLLSGKMMVDITGGFGVDSYYFSKVFDSVCYCDINAELAEIVSHNFLQLGANNVTVTATDGIRYLQNTNSMVDCIYADPSRRNATKGKVFLLEDCLPNIPNHLDLLFSKAQRVLIKYSPMLDISSAINKLSFVKEVHIIAVDNDVKELLFLLDKKENQNILIKTRNMTRDHCYLFNFVYQSAYKSPYSNPLSFLYEPNAAILKSGGFHEVTQQYPVYKLHEHSHLYTSNEHIDFPGRTFKIKTVLPYDKKRLKKLIPNQKANITTRNFPKSVLQIRKETQLKDGGNKYLFCTKTLNNRLLVIVCDKVT